MSSVNEARWQNALRLAKVIKYLTDRGYEFMDERGYFVRSLDIREYIIFYTVSGEDQVFFENNPDKHFGLQLTVDEFNAKFKRWRVLKPVNVDELLNSPASHLEDDLRKLAGGEEVAAQLIGTGDPSHYLILRLKGRNKYKLGMWVQNGGYSMTIDVRTGMSTDGRHRIVYSKPLPKYPKAGPRPWEHQIDYLNRLKDRI